MADTLQILHQSTGLKIVKNPRNRFAVITLHHTADPAKASPEWRREAAAGLTPEQAARELDIDYTAVMGSKVFPEITHNRANIVVPRDEYPTFGRHCKFWGGFDYGLRNPASFHVYTIDEGIVFSIWELYEPCPNIPAFVEKMKQCPYFPYLKYIAADPDCWSPKVSDGNPISIQEIFWRNGVRNFIKGINNQEDTWIGMMREHWGMDNPTFRIFEDCPAQIHEFESAIFVNQSERQLMTTSYRETINDKNNHSLDDCKYFFLSQPKAVTDTGWKDPEQWKRFTVPSGTRGITQQPIATSIPALRQRGYQ